MVDNQGGRGLAVRLQTQDAELLTLFCVVPAVSPTWEFMCLIKTLMSPVEGPGHSEATEGPLCVG